MADIIFVMSGIGGGKSLYGTRAILKELKTGDRSIVTNVPLLMNTWELPDDSRYLTVGQWCHKYCDEAVDVDRRLRVLTRDEVFQFYRYLPCGDLPLIEFARPKVGSRGLQRDGTVLVPDLGMRQNMQADGELPNGTLFVIDEAHLYFGSREWAEAGPGVSHYMSQLRKLNDDVLLLSQHPEKVDKNFRRDATLWVVMQNLEKTRLLFGVSFKKQFNIHEYPILPGRGDKPMKTTRIDLETDEMCFCYNTMGGVGLAAKLAPEDKAWKGRHWSVWLLALAVITVLAIFIPRLILKGSGMVAGGMWSAFSGGVEHTMRKTLPAGSLPNVANTIPSIHVPASMPRVLNAAPQLESPLSSTGGQFPSITSDTVFVGGLSEQGGRIKIFLTDGRSIWADDVRVHSITGAYVNIDGVRYPYANELKENVPFTEVKKAPQHELFAH